jgi:phenylacetate-CoA ligase
MSFLIAEEERLDPSGIAAVQSTKLDALQQALGPSDSFYRRKFEPLGVALNRGQWEALPFTTRAELEADQAEHPPFGTTHTLPVESYTRFHQTSGTTGRPIRWLDTPQSWEWWKRCWGMVFRGAGLRSGDRIVYPFSFGPFVGFWAAFESGTNLGNLCLAAGGMTTSARLRFIFDNEVTVVCCTPTYALRMAEVAAEERLDLHSSAVRLLVVAGEPGGHTPAVRSRIESAWSARVRDHVGMTEIGAYGFECEENPGGMHVIETEFVAEVIDPRSGELMPDGTAGELVLTNLGRLGSPLVRYRTGDQVVLTRGQCACGRWFARLEGGIQGRIDDMLVIRGNNVFPSAINGILGGFAEVAEYRLVVARAGATSGLRIEVEPRVNEDASALVGRIEDAVRDRLHFRPTVVAVEPGRLPRFEMKARRVVWESERRADE